MKRILVFNPSFIGDAILTTPLLQAIKEFFGDCEIDFCVRPESAKLFVGLDFIHEVIVFDKYGKDAGITGAYEFAQRLNLKHYDIVINVHRSFRSSLVLMMLDGLKVGFSSASMALMYDYVVRRRRRLHEVYRNFLLLSPFGCSLTQAISLSRFPTVMYNTLYTENMKNYLSSLGATRVLIVSPFAAWFTKSWLTERYAEVLDIMHERYGVISVLVGVSKDKDRGNELVSYLRNPNAAINLIGFTDVLEVASAIKAGDAILCCDSAALHMSVSLAVPSVSLWGATTLGLGFAPYQFENKLHRPHSLVESIIVEDVSLKCRPCGRHGGNKCPIGTFDCMKNIKTEMVVNALVHILGLGA